jgi:DNA mismatch repair protein MutL
VRFRESALIASVVADAVRETLRKVAAPTVSVTPELSLNSILRGASIDYNPPAMEQTVLPDLGVDPPLPEIHPELPVETPLFTSSVKPSGDSSFSGRGVDDIDSETAVEGPEVNPANILASTGNAAAPAATRDNRVSSTADDFALRIIGFLDETYILAASDSGLVVIDQHAAHERVLFEKLMGVAQEGDSVPSQRLLIPVTLDLAVGEVAFLKKSADALDELGFEIEPFGRNTVIVHAIPAALSDNDAESLVLDVLAALMEEGDGRGKPDKAAVATAALSGFETMRPSSIRVSTISVISDFASLSDSAAGIA